MSTDQEARAVSVLKTLVTGLDEGEPVGTLLNYINLLGRDVVEEKAGYVTAFKLATTEQRAACHAGELLEALRHSLDVMEIHGVGAGCGTQKEARTLLNQIDNPS